MANEPSKHFLDQPSSFDPEILPDGFFLTTCPNGTQCIVPEFLITGTHQMFDSYQKQMAMNIEKEHGRVSLFLHEISFIDNADANFLVANADFIANGFISIFSPDIHTDEFIVWKWDWIRFHVSQWQLEFKSQVKSS